MNDTLSPLVSIIICVYNGEKYLERCLQSAMSQSYKNIEIIVVNDGSMDNTPVIIAVSYTHLTLPTTSRV